MLALVEIVCAFYFISKLLARRASHPRSTSSLELKSEADSFNFSLQGALWVSPLPEGDLSKAVLLKPGKDKKKEKEDKDGSKESAKRVEATRDVPEITPVWRHVVLKDGVLFMKGADGVEEQISLESCEVLSVSSSSRPDGKWARRFPIKLYHTTRTIYRQYKGCLFYAESGYEKEAWCEVLRATARAKGYDKDWYSSVKKEFLEYTSAAEKHVPYLTRFHSTTKINHRVAKPTDEQSDDHKQSDEGVSKKRLILNKLLRRNGSKGKDVKDSKDEGNSRKGKGKSLVSDDHEDIKSTSNGSHLSNESHTRSESTSSDSDGDKSILAVSQKDNEESDEVLPSPLVHGHDNVRDEKEIDQGQLCLNMIVGRLFFDFYHSKTRVKWLQNQFQKLISRIKTPNYIKSITIKELDLGKDPPFATALRMLPADAAGALALEVDLEWQGGCFITIETRVDVRDQIAQDKIASQMAEPGSAGAAAAAIVSGIGEDLGTPGSSDTSEVVQARQASIAKNSGAGDDSSKKGGWMNSVKSMMSRVAVQVSQVPLLLKIRLVSVKGTCIVSLRAPPSDRLWFSFKEMPDIHLEPEPCIGDHRINSGLLGSYIANQIKVQIREQVVMPYCQDLFLHWMMATQDDWLPQSAIPVAFAAVEVSENERQISKQNIGVQPKPIEENNKNGQPTPCTPSVKNEQTDNGQHNLHTRQISVASSGSASYGSTVRNRPTYRVLHLHRSSHGCNLLQSLPLKVVFERLQHIGANHNSDIRFPLAHQEPQHIHQQFRQYEMSINPT